MSQGDASLEVDTRPTADERERTGSERRTGPAGMGARAARAVDSGILALIAAGGSLLWGIRDVSRRRWSGAVSKLILGGLFVAMAVTQRQSTGDSQRQGTATADERSPTEHGDTASRERHSETPPDVPTPATVSGYEKDAETGELPRTEDTEPESTSRSDEDASHSGAGGEEARSAAAIHDLADETYDRIGAASIDGQSWRVPAPQQAFNRGFLASGNEVYWGVRESDDAVVASQSYDPIGDAADVRYVASSEIPTDSRMVRVPDAVLDHWDGLADGGTVVTGGDELVFLTSDGLEALGQVRVLPGEWADSVLE